MILLDQTYLRNHADYSFGDESGRQLHDGYMNPANRSNVEFLNTVQTMKGMGRKYMTLFIDNIRLYHRRCRYTAVEEINPEWRHAKDQKIRELADQDLLKLCASIPDMDFVIFTGFEDTPIDEYIFDRIPDNVRGIYASNAIAFGGKVHPMPYGLQRKMTPADRRHELIYTMMRQRIQPDKLLYLNFSLFTNPNRITLHRHFAPYHWATVREPLSIDPDHYMFYLEQIKKHRFVLCPSGNAKGCDCHRDWETLYMKRVPVLERSPYLEAVFEGLPVLFVESFMQVTIDLLQQHEHLYQQAQRIDPDKLDIKKRYETIINDTNLHYQPSRAY